MTYIYLTTAIFFALVAAATVEGKANLIFLRLPAIVGAVTYGILAAKGFGLI